MWSGRARHWLRFGGAVCLAYVTVAPLAFLATSPYERAIARVWGLVSQTGFVQMANTASATLEVSIPKKEGDSRRSAVYRFRRGVLAANIALTVVLLALTPATGLRQRISRVVAGLTLLFFVDLFVAAGLLGLNGVTGAEGFLAFLNRSSPLLLWAIICSPKLILSPWRTEERVDALAKAQSRTEEALQDLSRVVRDLGPSR